MKLVAWGTILKLRGRGGSELMNFRTSYSKVRILYCGEGVLLAADGGHFVLWLLFRMIF